MRDRNSGRIGTHWLSSSRTSQRYGSGAACPRRGDLKVVWSDPRSLLRACPTTAPPAGDLSVNLTTPIPTTVRSSLPNGLCASDDQRSGGRRGLRRLKSVMWLEGCPRDGENQAVPRSARDYHRRSRTLYVNSWRP